MRIIICIIFICFGSHNVLSVPQRHSFVRASLPQRFRINTCFPTSNLTHFLTTRLETCGVTSPFRVIGMGECQGSCVMNPDCVAFTYTKENRMCTHCDKSILQGQGLNTTAQDEIMIVVERLEAYINGKYLNVHINV